MDVPIKLTQFCDTFTVYAKIMIKLKIMKIKVDTHLSSVNKHFSWHLSNASTENWGWKIICFTSGVSGAIASTFLDFYLHRKDINRGLDPASYSVLFCFASTFPHVQQQQQEEEEGPGPKLLKNVVAAATSGGRLTCCVPSSQH